jgi:hypothetical protein
MEQPNKITTTNNFASLDLVYRFDQDGQNWEGFVNNDGCVCHTWSRAGETHAQFMESVELYWRWVSSWLQVDTEEEMMEIAGTWDDDGRFGVIN